MFVFQVDNVLDIVSPSLRLRQMVLQETVQIHMEHLLYHMQDMESRRVSVH